MSRNCLLLLLLCLLSPVSSSLFAEVERVEEYTIEHETGLFGRCENDTFAVPGRVVSVGIQIIESKGISSWARVQSGTENPVVVRWCSEAFSSIKYKVTIVYRQ